MWTRNFVASSGALTQRTAYLLVWRLLLARWFRRQALSSEIHAARGFLKFRLPDGELCCELDSLAGRA